MANTLNIAVTEFHRLDADNKPVVSYGWTASDGYGVDFDDSFDAWAEFYDRFQSKESLISMICTLDAFADFDMDKNPIDVVGYKYPVDEPQPVS